MWVWRKEITKLLLLIIIAAIVSLFIGNLPLLIISILLFALIQQAILIRRLERWLSEGAGGKIPKGSGIWEDIYYHFYRLRNSNKKRKKQLSKMLKQFRQSTDVLPDAAVVLGKDHEIEWSNKLARDVLGLKKSDKGQRIPNLIRVPEFVEYLKNYAKNPALTLPSPVDPQLILQFRIVDYAAGQRLLIAHDVTEQKQLEVMRKNFVANVSHELRTPLTVLKGYLETLQDMGECETPLLTHSLTKMHAQTERMQYLVNDLLLLARLETQKKTIRYVDISSLIEEVCIEANKIETLPRVNLKLNTDEGLYGEEEELRSAFSNLIMNALKYSPEDSPVKVSWSSKDKQLIFDVIDEGEGIAAANIFRVTERFYRIDVKRSRKLSGTGLGLAIVKHVLMRHDAKLEITSQLGKGSHFRCIFPTKKHHKKS